MRPLPIRWKFALWTTALVAVALLLFSGGAIVNLYNEQIDAVDLEIQAAGGNLTRLTSVQMTSEIAEEIIRDQPLLSFALIDKAGQTLKVSKRMSGNLVKRALISSGLHTMKSEEGTMRVALFQQGNARIVLAYSLNEVEETFGDILLAFGMAMPIVLGVAALGGWWVAGRALTPIRHLIIAAEHIDSEQLSHRVPLTTTNDELHRLATVFNAMLDRLEKSFVHTKRFAADASHELRTPLTIMRGEIERLLREPNLPPNFEVKLISLQEEIARLERITESLLLLTQLDAGSAALERSPVNFSALVNEACEDAELLGEFRQVKIIASNCDNVQVLGDAVHLRRILLNLLDNSTKFNVVGGIAQCELFIEDRQAICRIRNTGPGIPAELRPRVFQRFFRGEGSRAGREMSHGLGLSIAREIARAHGGDLRYASTAEPGWTEFVVILPTI